MKQSSVRLRALEPEDVEMLYELENDPDLWAVGDCTAPYSRHTLQRYIDSNANDIYADRQLRLVIEVEGQPAGCADLFLFNPQNHRAEVGIALLPQWRGKGYGREALTQLTAFSRQHLDIAHLYAIVSVENLSAQALFASCGYENTARLKSWVTCTPTPQDALVFQNLIPRN